MKTKTLNLIIASIFTFVFLAGLASATITLSGVPTTLSQTGNSFTITVTSNQNETITLSAPSISDGHGKSITFTPVSVELNTSNPSDPVTVQYTVESGFQFEFANTYSSVLMVNGTVSGTVPVTLNFASSDFCEYGNPGDLNVKISDVRVKSGFGEDDEWLPLDEVELDVDVENNGDEDLNDVVIEWGLYNPDTKEWVIEIDEETDFNLDENDEENLVISFNIDDNMDVDLADLEDGTYTFYVRATGEVDNDTSLDTCESASKNVKLVIEKDFVTMSEFEFSETVQCSSEFHLSADVWNIGSSDQDDVYVKIINRDLGIDKRVDIGDIDSFENELLDFTFTMPDDVEEKSYSLTISVYNEDDDVFENDYNDDTAVFTKSFKVSGGCAKSEASVTASLYSGGQAGKPLVVKATVVNTGIKETSYLLNAASYTTWASSAKVEPTSFSLNAGESRDVMITFNVNKDASGDNIFNLEILSENELITNQPVQVPVKKAGLSLSGLSLNNWHLWAIGALNLILVIFIIVIAIRISRK